MRSIVLTSVLFLLAVDDNVDRNAIFQQHYRAAMQSYQQKDYPAMIRHLSAADSMRPNTHVVVYNLAAAYALNGQIEEAFHHLRRSLWLNADSGFTKDEDLAALKSSPNIDDLVSSSRFFYRREFHASEAFHLLDSTFHPEGIAYDPVSGAFFTGSIRRGTIAKIENGKVDPNWSQVPYSAMGMRVDAERRTLWIGTTAMPEFIDYHDSLKGRAVVIAVNLKNGRTEKTYTVEGRHVFGDLCVGSNGDVYVSDSEEPNIYRIADGRMELWHRIDTAWNLQGIDVTPDGRYLFIADYISGIYRIEIATRKTQRILCEPMTALRGIDGLRLQGHTLVAIHNGVRPFRVTRLVLDETGLRIGRIDFIARAALELNEPTLGTVVGSEFYFIANSPWAAYDKNGFHPEKAAPPVVFKVPLKN
jgi:hypothetical protein